MSVEGGTLQRELLQGQETIKSLENQIQELFNVLTDNERALESWKERQEASKGAYKFYRQAVEESCKLIISLDTDSPPFLPQEIVEEERKATDRSIAQLKHSIEAMDDLLHKAQTRIQELQESETLLRGDIRTEIERTKTVTSCTDSTTPTDTNHLTHAAVISLYEKMTGIFITGVRFEGDPQVPGGPINYQCVYTQPSDAGAKTIKFQLWGWQETGRDSQEAEYIRYTPLDLDEEPAFKFKGRLELMGSSFIFERGQTHVFVGQLEKCVAEAAEKEAKVIEVLSDGQIDSVG